jgi:hypothetical protein
MATEKDELGLMGPRIYRHQRVRDVIAWGLDQVVALLDAWLRFDDRRSRRK